MIHHKQADKDHNDNDSDGIRYEESSSCCHPCNSRRYDNTRSVWDCIKNRTYTWFLIAILVMTTSVDYVLYTRFSKELLLYALPAMQILYALAFTLVVWPMLGLRWLWQYWRDRVAQHKREAGRMRGGTSALVKQHGLCCGRLTGIRSLWRSYLLIAFLDATGNMLEFLPLVYLNSELLVIVGQVHLPVLLVFSAIYLGRRYRGSHYFAIVLVALGIAVALVPSIDEVFVERHQGQHAIHPTNSTNITHINNMTNATTTNNVVPSSSSSLPTLTDDATGWNALLWVGLFVLGTLPHGFSKVYQERLMKRYNVEPMRVLAGVAPFQLLLSAPMVLVLLLPLPAPAPHVLPGQLGTFLMDSARCLFLAAPISNVTAASLQLDRAPICDNALSVFLAFLAFNLLFNMVALALTKHTTANTSAVSSVIRLGLSSLLFMSPWLAGSAARTVTRIDVLSLILLAVALLLYRYRNEIIDMQREKVDPKYFYSALQLEKDLPEYMQDRGVRLFDEFSGRSLDISSDNEEELNSLDIDLDDSSHSGDGNGGTSDFYDENNHGDGDASSLNEYNPF